MGVMAACGGRALESTGEAKGDRTNSVHGRSKDRLHQLQRFVVLPVSGHPGIRRPSFTATTAFSGGQRIQAGAPSGVANLQSSWTAPWLRLVLVWLILPLLSVRSSEI